MIARIADDGITGAGEIFFGRAGDGGIKSGENEVAIERGIEAFDDEIARVCGNRSFEMPVNGLGVRLAGGTLRGGDFGELKPGMIRKEMNEALADHAGGAENAGANFSSIAPERGSGEI
jgi:hypothetical protein